MIWTAILVSIVAGASKNTRDKLTNDNQLPGLCIGGRPRVLSAPGAAQPGGLGTACSLACFTACGFCLVLFIFLPKTLYELVRTGNVGGLTDLLKNLRGENNDRNISEEENFIIR